MITVDGDPRTDNIDPFSQFIPCKATFGALNQLY